ncbi:MAG TPA: N-acetyl-gamma-glutamyl-phosphate reductase [Thermoanaerobaculia bacterium]|jgi:N-acetyl-gamma-glutamyl-phosphate reductase|nr:N-acetyl-gamma-glutamyl-phosphate reductase [Thermoanaerobaculia bacterium]
MPIPSSSVCVSVVGATGYAGGELVALLARHCGARLGRLYSGPNGARVPFSRLHRSLAGREGPDAAPLDIDELLESDPDAVFLATPNEVSAEIAPLLLDWDPDLKIVDLSGAFRLGSADDYPAWYGFSHPRPELLAESVYGLTEWARESVPGARLVANPGCYPTSVLLALKPVLPLLDASQPVVCDCKSGTSGAGRRGDVAYSFSELAGNLRAYGAGTHRHEPEMRQQLGLADAAPFVFVPHLLPTVRGILSTVYVGFPRPVAADELARLYEAAYGDSALIDVRPAGTLPDLNDVVGTPRAAIGFTLLEGGRRAVLVSVLDNLLKGAASQAVQNFNLLFGRAETEGLA